MPLREAEVTASLFRVGSHLDFTATHDGELVCFVLTCVAVSYTHLTLPTTVIV